MKIRELIQKYSDVIPYLFFGVCTTAVNVASYWVFAHVLRAGTLPSSVLAWVTAVTFAYVTNRRWVFHSDAHGGAEIAKEAATFFGCRLATGVVDWTCMFVFVDLLHWNDVLVKTGANVIVIVLNYFASKLVTFRKR